MSSLANSQPLAAGEAAHTPTPYFAQSALAVSGSHLPWSCVIRSTETGRTCAIAYGITREDAEANAAFIVRACNAYDADQSKIAELTLERDNARSLAASEVKINDRAQRKIAALAAEHESNAKIYDYMSDSALYTHSPLLAEIRRKARELVALAKEGQP